MKWLRKYDLVIPYHAVLVLLIVAWLAGFWKVI